MISVLHLEHLGLFFQNFSLLVYSALAVPFDRTSLGMKGLFVEEYQWCSLLTKLAWKSSIQFLKLGYTFVGHVAVFPLGVTHSML